MLKLKAMSTMDVDVHNHMLLCSHHNADVNTDVDDSSDDVDLVDDEEDWNAPELVDFEILDLVGSQGNAIYQARRRADGAEFIAQSMDLWNKYPLHLGMTVPDNFSSGEEEAGFRGNTLLAIRNHEIKNALLALLNHENLVSLAALTRRRNMRLGSTETYLIWDYCDAGSLTNIFQTYPPPMTRLLPYLPESLCWHVLKSVLRAITYLHDGIRFKRDGTGVYRGGQFSICDFDWNPVLHRSIDPDHILFQHPRGRETYGTCKLGDFSRAVVCGHSVSSRQESNGIAVAPAHQRPRDEWDGLLQLRQQLEQSSDDSAKPTTHPSTLAHELWCLGAVVLRMMTGEALAEESACPTCGQESVRYDDSAERKCARDSGCVCLIGGCKCGNPSPEPKSPGCHHAGSVDRILLRAPYTRYLRDTVQALLRCHWQCKTRCVDAKGFLLRAEAQYRVWKTSLIQGQRYVDLDDDMARRSVAAAQGQLPKKG